MTVVVIALWEHHFIESQFCAFEVDAVSSNTVTSDKSNKLFLTAALAKVFTGFRKDLLFYAYVLLNTVNHLGSHFTVRADDAKITA